LFAKSASVSSHPRHLSFVISHLAAGVTDHVWELAEVALANPRT
jgi:hypothetical protein